MTPRNQDYKIHPVDGLWVLYSRPRGTSAEWLPVDAVDAPDAETARLMFVGRAVSGIHLAEVKN